MAASTGIDSLSEVRAQASVASRMRPRLTGMLRARLYPADRVHFDLDTEGIHRYQALEAERQRTGGSAGSNSGFNLPKFVKPNGLAGDRHDAREYFNSFVNQCGKLCGEDVDRLSVSEFIYDTTVGTGASQEDDEQISAIQDVLVTFTKQDFGRLKSLAQRLHRYDRFPAEDAKAKEASKSKTVQTEMEFEFGLDIDFRYPLDSLDADTAGSSAPWRSVPSEPLQEDRQELFMNRAKALITADSQAASSKSKSSSSSKVGRQEELIWFRDSCEMHLVKQQSSGAAGSSSSSSAAVSYADPSSSLTVEELMGQLLETLDNKGQGADENALLELLGFEAFEFITGLVERRSKILEDWAELKKHASDLVGKQQGNSGGSKGKTGPSMPGPSISVMSESERRNAKASKKAATKQNKASGESTQLAALQLLATLGTDPDDPDGELELKKPIALAAKAASSEKKSNIHQSHLAGMGLRLTLPEGTERKMLKGYERVDVPAAPPFDPDKQQVKYIYTKELPKWAQVAFKGIEKLNTIQSVVFNAAFGRSQNLLICAPTGAGKTNIAILTILRLIGQHMDAAGGIGRDFKVVYMAPMKALVGEIAEKFGQRLGPLGVNVAEFTGDMSLTKKELESVHVIVTVPEKWDVMTRNSAAGGGLSDDGLQKLVQLLIIDEVHLLNDDRGAVIETVVARSLRYQETSGQPVRIAALSATLPNYQDVAAFLRVEAENLFYFDSSYRPIPLDTAFLGITETNRVKQMAKLMDICWDAVLDQVKRGHQVMVFVHSRGDTFKTAQALAQLAQESNQQGVFDMRQHPQYGHFLQQVQKSRNRQVAMIFNEGFGIHHAGMLRADRTLTEKMFLAGVIPVLCCTATLAWGVNLPARSVVIKGTSIFDSQAGGYKDLGILDVQQIFGRAGRPGFDTKGHATLITTHDKLNNYLRLLLHQMPIESKFLENMANSLNAEIAMGNVSSEKDAADWLRYTYLFVRFFRTPQKYGITQQDFDTDPTLEKKRREFANEAAQKLCGARLIRIDNNKNYNSTDLGRVAARFYVDWETAELFSKGTIKGMSDDRILALFGKAHEFQQLKTREDEQVELDQMMNDPDICPVRVLGGADNTYGKVAILLQVYLSRRFIDSFSLISDCNYVLQNASRLFRALFEITMTRVTSMSEMSDRLLEWCKMIEQRLWQSQHVLRAFCYPPASSPQAKKAGMSLDDGPKGGVLKEQIVKKLEDANFDYWTIINMTVSELTNITGTKDWGKAVDKYMKRVPNLQLDAKIQPITSTIMRITLIIKPIFDWSDRWSGPSEPFWVWVENPESQDILHSEYYVLHKRNVFDSGQLSFAIPLTEPRPPQYVISVVSDRWVGVKFCHEFAVQHLLLPDRQKAHTPLLELTPLPVTSLHNANFERLYKFTHFNPIQTQVFHTCYHTDYNVLLGAPTGSGKTNVAELTMFRLFNNSPHEKVIYIAPLKALARERMEDWEERFQRQLGKTVVELTGDFTPDVDALERADVVVSTPEKWDGISRHWQHRAYVRNVGLIIIDEIHLLGQDRGPVLEVIVSRMRYISCNLDKAIRFVGLSTALANAHDIADWLGIGIVGLYNFKPSVRPVPMTAHIQGYPEKHFVARMAQMNKPCFHAIKNHAVKPDGIKPTLIFVSSRRQTRLTALDIVAFMSADPDEDPKQFCKMAPHELEYATRRVTDQSLKHTLEFGIGIHHAGLPDRDRKVVEELFVGSKIMVLISTSTLAWGVNFPAHLVIIKGTEYYDGQLKRYVDFPITDVLQMMGRAGRPQFDNEARAVVMVHEPKKNFYRRFIYEPFPVESSLHEQLTDHLNAEIVAKTIKTREEAIDYVTWTYFFRRLTANPAYYDQQAALLEQTDFEKQRDMLANYIERLMNKCLDELIRSGCIELKEQPMIQGKTPSAAVDPTKLGRIASLYYLSHRTVAQFQRTLAREGMSFVEILRVLCECPEYDELPVRHNEDKLNAEFAELCPLEVDLAIQAYDSPHTKAFLLLQAHMWCLALPINDYKTDLKSVLDRSIPLIQAMVDIAAEEAQLRSTLNLILLLQCLHQAHNPWRTSLACIPHLSDKNLKVLKGMAVESLPELIERRDASKILTKLSLPTADAHKELLQLVQELPRLRVRVELRILDPETAEDAAAQEPEEEMGQDRYDSKPKRRKGRLVPEPYEVPPDSELELTVILHYDNLPMKFVHAPRFPKKKTYSWWVILGDTEVDELVSIKKALMPTRQRYDKRVNFQFCSPADEVGETFTLSVLCMSDSFFGLDQQLDLSITTVAATGAGAEG
eukprot:TRINITY_DN16541_c0_g2_i1.p1 TRINITY_DN16541_c0_g2~~TRINITY_DN16541_c0_g2_i1.p1  ORF type:complete len:2306 (+),score=474.18 TRINITY_DN16541_c0_g2_i1:62-6919(+)